MTLNASDRLRTKQAAAFLDVSASTLAKWRVNGSGPPYHRRGSRLVHYLRHELVAWLAECDLEISRPPMKAR